MRLVADADPIGQFIRERIAIVKKTAGLDEEPTGVRARPPGHPADRPGARYVGKDLDGAADMFTLDVLRDRPIVDPAIAMTDHLVAALYERAGEVRILLQRARDREHADLDGEIPEYLKHAPDAAPAAILENRLYQRHAAARDRGHANVVEHGFRSIIAIRKGCLAPAFDIQIEIDRDRGLAGPIGIGRKLAIADKIARSHRIRLHLLRGPCSHDRVSAAVHGS